MVWRKIIAVTVLLSCILLVAATGSPANAAEDSTFVPSTLEVCGAVSPEVLEIFRSYLFSHPLDPDMDYILFCTDKDFVWTLFAGHGNQEGSDYYFEVEFIVLLYKQDSDNLQLVTVSENQSVVISNPEFYLLYSNLGNNLSIYDRSDTFAVTSLFMLGTALCCYLLRSIFSFCLRRKS